MAQRCDRTLHEPSAAKIVPGWPFAPEHLILPRVGQETTVTGRLLSVVNGLTGMDLRSRWNEEMVPNPIRYRTGTKRPAGAQPAGGRN